MLSILTLNLNYIWHIEFSWKKVVRDDSTGAINDARSVKVWESLSYIH